MWWEETGGAGRFQHEENQPEKNLLLSFIFQGIQVNSNSGMKSFLTDYELFFAIFYQHCCELTKRKSKLKAYFLNFNNCRIFDLNKNSKVEKYNCCTQTLSISPYEFITAGLCSHLRLFFFSFLNHCFEIFDPSVRYTGLAVPVHPHSPPQKTAKMTPRGTVTRFKTV